MSELLGHANDYLKLRRDRGYKGERTTARTQGVGAACWVSCT